jgi:hypothetical protein
MSARIALAYGPGTKKHDTRVLNQFIEKALVQKRIELLDSGEATRTYCYIDDVVEMLWNIVLRGNQEVYNVGGHSVTSIADLAMRIRVQASRAISPAEWLRKLWDRAHLHFENIFRPLAVPATGGVLTALVVFVFAVQSMLVGVPLGGVVANDLPLNLVQPARLESLAPFPVPGIEATDGRSNSNPLLVEATLNAQGQVVSFRILSGPSGPDVERQLDQVLLFSRFRPRISFGRPTDGGRVLLSFSEVQVRG